MGFPTDLRSATEAVLAAVAAANPTFRIKAVSGARPASVVPTHLWVDEVRMDLAHDSGTRRWRCDVDVIIAYDAFANEDGQDRADVVLSAVLDAFTAAPHWPDPNGLGNAVHGGTVRVRSTGVAINAVEVPAFVVTLGDIYLQEGR